MRILFIHNAYQYRGGEDTVLDLESGLLESKGHTVSVLKFNNEHIKSFGSKLKAGIRSFYNKQSAKQLNEVISHFKPDIIHVHNLFFQASPSVLFVASRLRIPVVMTIHNYRLICSNALLLRNNQVCELCTQKKLPLSGIKYKCYRSSAVETGLVTGITGIHKLLHTWTNKIQKVIVLSEFMKSKLSDRSLSFRPEQLVVKPNFLPDVRVDEVRRKAYFLYVGRLSVEKGINTLLKSFAGLPDQQLVIVGDGPEKEQVLAAVRECSWISYAGAQPREKVLEMMAACTALIFPSIWYEGMPLTIIESLATGTPVITSGLGVMAEMIRDGYNGYHFNPGNADDLKEKIKKFSTIHSDRFYLYKNARNAYLDYYQPDVHYASIMKIYQNALSQF